ncbi:hypothetical protein [Vagococcus silagei]|uniref:Uncharacterized protein n=1 Tax=Vagococcus silagei TaxID=2508885 RepID=A0A4S3B4A4_9ENTE|nr:hypothetical protein [Vagococcus silagei]THB60620.1 hypothetical protein ESZ54_09410 [Vagococcus silagei]
MNIQNFFNYTLSHFEPHLENLSIVMLIFAVCWIIFGVYSLIRKKTLRKMDYTGWRYVID